MLSEIVMSDILEYNIVCIVNELYAQHAAVMLQSLIDTNKGNRLKIYVVTNYLRPSTIKKIELLADINGISVHIIKCEINNLEIDGLKCGTEFKSWNMIMYVKFFLPILLSNDIRRFLFVDVDVVFNYDIKLLYEMDLKENIIAACEDYLYCHVHKERLDLTEKDLYINTGVMLVDLNAWHKKLTKNPLREFIQNVANLVNNDQDLFALYFKGDICLMPTNQWNATTFFFEKKPRVLPQYLDEIDIVRKKPYIIHFCEPIKPWYKECKHPYRDLYKKYLKKTPWANYRFITCGSAYGKPCWVYTLKYWLNVLGLRNDDMAMIRDIL